MSGLHHWTPTFDSKPLAIKTGKKIFLKMECYQEAGSYKIRGLGRLCEEFALQGKQYFVSSSGGNAGFAVAYAGKKLKIKTTVFLPSTTQKIYVDAIQSYGAKVHVVGDVWDQADEACRDYVKTHEAAAYIPPFDHPLIWQGHAMMIDEVAAQSIRPDAVVLAVGGGGLACGVLQGMHQHGWSDVPLFTVETEGAASFMACVHQGKWVSIPAINTIATTLGAKRVTERLFQWWQQHPITPLTVTDRQAVLACQNFLDDHRVFVEPASGAALAVIYDQYPELEPYQSILVIVCGGIGISQRLLEHYLEITKR